MLLPLLLTFLLPVGSLLANSTPLSVYGLFAPSTSTSTSTRSLSAACGLLSTAWGVQAAPAEEAVVEVPSPSSLNLLKDDRINVPSRVLLMQGGRRAYSDLGDALAVSLALGHHAAWLRFQRSGQPLGLFLVEPESIESAAPEAAAAAAAALRQALGQAGSAWDLLLLGALVPPQRALPCPHPAMADAGWVVPLRWRAWHAYVLTQAGVQALLKEGALPLSQRSEAFASTLVDLGRLKALALAADPSAMRAAGGGAATPLSPLIPRPAGWAAGPDSSSGSSSDIGSSSSSGGGSSSEQSLAQMLAETPCDLCAVPEDYSRMGHIAMAAGPTAVIAALATVYALHAVGLWKGRGL
jgi:hypothetical protein